MTWRSPTIVALLITIISTIVVEITSGGVPRCGKIQSRPTGEIFLAQALGKSTPLVFSGQSSLAWVRKSWVKRNKYRKMPHWLLQWKCLEPTYMTRRSKGSNKSVGLTLTLSGQFGVCCIPVGNKYTRADDLSWRSALRQNRSVNRL